MSAIQPIVQANTVDVPSAERFDYFCDAVCQVYLGVQPQRASERSFDAQLLAYDFGAASLARITAPGSSGFRNRALIAAKPDPAFYLNFSDLTPWRGSHVDRQWQVRRAAPLLLDSELPFRVDFDADRPMRLYSLRIPKVERMPSREMVQRLDERITTTVAGRQLTLQTRLMCAEFDAGRLDVAAAMSSAVLVLLGVLFDDDLSDRGDNDKGARLVGMQQVAASRLDDPDFGIHELAAIIGCSVRTVQNEFARGGETFAAWALDRRLETARQRLTSARWAGKTVAAIAAATGFRDDAHFNRAFKRRFSISPGAARALV